MQKLLTESINQDSLVNKALSLFIAGRSLMNTTKSTGKLIAFEGIDGSGKSTIAARLVALLQEDGCRVVLTREPGGTGVNPAVRTIIQEGSFKAVPEAEFLLFAADRAAHVAQCIKPELERGAIVISDRMSDSSYAYQAYGRGVDPAMVQSVNSWVMHNIKPDLTIYLVVDYATAQQRMQTRRSTPQIYDHERASFFRNVAKGYDTLYGNRTDVLRIDATLPLEKIVTTIYHRVCSLIGTESHG